MGGWWAVVAYRILLSAPGPFGFNWVLGLIGTWLGLGLGGFGTKGLGPGLDNYSRNLDLVISLRKKYLRDSFLGHQWIVESCLLFFVTLQQFSHSACHMTY